MENLNELSEEDALKFLESVCSRTEELLQEVQEIQIHESNEENSYTPQTNFTDSNQSLCNYIKIAQLPSVKHYSFHSKLIASLLVTKSYSFLATSCNLTKEEIQEILNYASVSRLVLVLPINELRTYAERFDNIPFQDCNMKQKLIRNALRRDPWTIQTVLLNVLNLYNLAVKTLKFLCNESNQKDLLEQCLVSRSDVISEANR